MQDKLRRRRLFYAGAILGSVATLAGCGSDESNSVFAKQTLEAEVGCDSGKAVVIDATTEKLSVSCKTIQGVLKAPETFGPRPGRFALVANENPPTQKVYVFVRKSETQTAFMDKIRVNRDRIQAELNGVEQIISAAPTN